MCASGGGGTLSHGVISDLQFKTCIDSRSPRHLCLETAGFRRHPQCHHPLAEITDQYAPRECVLKRTAHVSQVSPPALPRGDPPGQRGADSALPNHHTISPASHRRHSEPRVYRQTHPGSRVRPSRHATRTTLSVPSQSADTHPRSDQRTRSLPQRSANTLTPAAISEPCLPSRSDQRTTLTLAAISEPRSLPQRSANKRTRSPSLRSANHAHSRSDKRTTGRLRARPAGRRCRCHCLCQCQCQYQCLSLCLCQYQCVGAGASVCLRNSGNVSVCLRSSVGATVCVCATASVSMSVPVSKRLIGCITLVPFLCRYLHCALTFGEYQGKDSGGGGGRKEVIGLSSSFFVLGLPASMFRLGSAGTSFHQVKDLSKGQ